VAITDIQYLDDSTIVLASNVRGIFYSISRDNGLTWTHVNANLFSYPEIKSLGYSTIDSIIAIGTGFNNTNGAILNQPRGNSFLYWHQTPFNLNEITMVTDTAAFIVGDSGTIITNVSFTTSVVDLPANATAISLFPNPTSDQFTVESDAMKVIKVYSVDGKLVHRIQCHNQTQVTVNSTTLIPGVYVVKIHYNSGEIASRKITIN